jgi:hypothetical protein
MAFVPDALTKVSMLNGPAAHAVTPDPGLWYYDSGADNLAAVVTAGYFNNARNDFLGPPAGKNLLMAICSDGFRILRVTAPVTGNVTVTALLGAVS